MLLRRFILKRLSKRRLKNTLLQIFSILLIFLFLILLFFMFKSAIPLFKAVNNTQRRDIIKPLGISASKQDLEKKLKEKNIIIESLDESSRSALIIAKIADGPKVYFSKNLDPSWQVNSLHLIISKLTIDNKKPILVDLRYARPIVKF